MAKNIIIGLLVVAVLIGGGYLLSRDNSADDANLNTNNNGTENNQGSAYGYETPNPVTIPSPSAPTVRTGENPFPTTSAVGLSGEVRPNGATTTYWFEYGETSSLGQKTTDQNIGSSYTFISTPGFISGLKTNTEYFFRLSAKNSFGTVNGTTRSFRTNAEPNPTGSIPTISTSSANTIERTSANLRGQVNPRGAETRYWFEYGKDTNLGSITQIQTLASGTTSIAVASSVTGLDPATRYYFRINAQNRFGTVNGSILNFTTDGPSNTAEPTVTTVAADSITQNRADLNGRVNPNGVQTTYWFEYSKDSLLGNIIGTKTPDESLPAGTASRNVDARITGLEPNTKYFYRVIARNQHGTVRGDEFSFTTDQ